MRTLRLAVVRFVASTPVAAASQGALPGVKPSRINDLAIAF